MGDSCDIYDQDMRCVLVMRSALVDGVSVKYGLIYNEDFPLPGFICCATHLKLSGSINCLLGVPAKGRVSPLTSAESRLIGGVILTKRYVWSFFRATGHYWIDPHSALEPQQHANVMQSRFDAFYFLLDICYCNVTELLPPKLSWKSHLGGSVKRVILEIVNIAFN